MTSAGTSVPGRRLAARVVRRYAIVDSQMPVLASDDLQRRHPIKGIPVFGNLTGEFVRVGPLRRWPQMEFARIDISE